MSRFVTPDGVEEWIGVHDELSCGGWGCPIHKPSAHKMVDWPMRLHHSTVPLVERLCEHNIRHPDPDSVAWLARTTGMRINLFGHTSCDGCCVA